MVHRNELWDILAALPPIILPTEENVGIQPSFPHTLYHLGSYFFHDISPASRYRGISSDVGISRNAPTSHFQLETGSRGVGADPLRQDMESVLRTC